MEERIGERIRWMGSVLRSGAEHEIREYQRRFSSASSLYDAALCHLLIQSFDVARSCETSKRFFGTNVVRFAAVDGTSYSKLLFDLVVFFGGSYAATGEVRFTPSGIRVDYDPDNLQDAKGICACAPVYVSQVAEIDQTTWAQGQDGVSAGKLLTDSDVVANSEMASRMMTFSEFYLAYKLASDRQKPVRIILMDRTLSGEIGSLIFDTSKRSVWSRVCSILGYPVEGTPIDENELFYSRHRIHNADLQTLSPRGDYLRYAILHYLEAGNKGDLHQISNALGLTGAQKDRASRQLKRLKAEGMIGDILGDYRMASRYECYWQRVRSMVCQIGDRMFAERADPSACMALELEGSRKQLTSLDLAFLTLFAINMLIEECWSRRIILIGLTKDTAARDFKRHVLPLLSNIGAFPERIDAKTFQEIPDTDRMFLQATSMMNAAKLNVPWALAEYDCAMRTVVHDPSAGMDRVRGSIKNKIVPERLLLKSYIQLAEAHKDERFRSNVLLTDRLAYPGFDAGQGDLMELKNEYGGAVEPVRLVLPRDASKPGELQNMVVCVLAAMTSSDIPELFGHNKPLFIADKVAKWNNECFRRMVDTTASWIMTNRDVRDFVFYMSSFKERRSGIEQSRRIVEGI